MYYVSPTKKAQFNLIYLNQLLGIQAFGIQALRIRAVHHPDSADHGCMILKRPQIKLWPL